MSVQAAMLPALVLLAGLGAAAAAAAAAPAPRRALQQATGGQGCVSKLNYDDVFMPPEAHFVWRFEMTGTRNFSCQESGLRFGPALGVGTATSAELGLECQWYYESPFRAVVECPGPAGGPLAGRGLFDTTVPGAVFVLPAPEPGNDVWARLKVTSEGALASANYAVRYNTSGGAPPPRCDAPRGQWVTVPFTAVFDGYLCQ